MWHFCRRETLGMLTANRAAPEQITAPEMLMVLTPHTLFEASFYTETSPLQIDLTPAVLCNISPCPFGVWLLFYAFLFKWSVSKFWLPEMRNKVGFRVDTPAASIASSKQVTNPFHDCLQMAYLSLSSLFVFLSEMVGKTPSCTPESGAILTPAQFWAILMPQK